jgi:hypothetical protein
MTKRLSAATAKGRNTKKQAPFRVISRYGFEYAIRRIVADLVCRKAPMPAEIDDLRGILGVLRERCQEKGL